MDWKTTVAGTAFPNPLLLASGILNETGASMARAVREGAGGVVTKSMSADPRAGHPNPTVVEVREGLLNAMGLPGPGIDHFAEEMQQALAADAVVVGSVFGKTAAEYAQMAARMEQLGAAAIELNVSCPHAKGLGSELGSDPKILGDVVAAAKDAVSVPVWTKLTPNTQDIVALGKAAEEAGTDALVCTNTLKAIAIHPAFRRPVLGNGVGGLSGHALKPVALRAVWDLYPQVDVPIVASGGIYSHEDVLEFAMAGAVAFQVGTAVMHEGWPVFREILGGLEAWMADEAVASLADITGVAHEAGHAKAAVGTAG